MKDHLTNVYTGQTCYKTSVIGKQRPIAYLQASHSSTIQLPTKLTTVWNPFKLPCPTGTHLVWTSAKLMFVFWENLMFSLHSVSFSLSLYSQWNIFSVPIVISLFPMGLQRIFQSITTFTCLFQKDTYEVSVYNGGLYWLSQTRLETPEWISFGITRLHIANKTIYWVMSSMAPTIVLV